MTTELETTFTWNMTVKVPGRIGIGPNMQPPPTKEQIGIDAKTIMDNVTMERFAAVMKEQGITDYALLGLTTEIISVSQPHFVLRPDFWNSGFQSEVQGKTIVHYFDQGWEAIATLVLASIAAYIIAHPVIVVVGLLFILAVVGFVVLSAAIVDMTTGLAAALDLAVATPAGAFVTILMVLAAIGFSMILVLTLLPGLGQRLKEKIHWRKKEPY